MLLVSGGVVKSGSVALYQYLRQIVQTFANGYAPVMPMGEEEEYFQRNLFHWSSRESIYVIKQHSWRDEFASANKCDRLRVVMTYRDLRDTCLSVRDFRNDHFEGVIASKILQRIRDSEQRWRDEMEIGKTLWPIAYEKMRTEPVTEIMGMAMFIGIRLDVSEAKFIAEKWSIHANRARARQNWPINHPEFMSPRHISSGNVDRWRKELTRLQAITVQHHVGEQWFLDRGYELDYGEGL